MIKTVTIVLLSLSLLLPAKKTAAQAQELEQLVLNIEKLMQFREILSDMKAGYDMLAQGYNALQNISQGNFSLHQVFLDGLLQVSPAVKKYSRVARIVEDQRRLVKEYQRAYKQFASSGLFAPYELDYVQRVYGQLFDHAVNHLSDLTTILTGGKLRMSDQERLSAIDHIYGQMQEQLIFLRHFNNQTTRLALQRTKAGYDIQALEKMYK